MRKKTSINESVIKLLYLKYKRFLWPSVLMIFSFIILLFILIPQFNFFLESKNKSKEMEKKISILKANYEFLSKLDEFKLNSELETVSHSLPTEKNFVPILNTISSSTNNSGVVLGDYGFSVGDLSTESAQIKTESFIQIDLEASGDRTTMKNFLFELSKKLPLSESVTLDWGTSNSLVTVYFYHKPFYKIPFDLFSPIRQRTEKEIELLNQLESFEKSKGEDFLNKEITEEEISSELSEEENINLEEENLSEDLKAL